MDFLYLIFGSLIISVPDQSDQSLGIAIVNFANPASAEIAVQLSGAVFNDRFVITQQINSHEGIKKV